MKVFFAVIFCLGLWIQEIKPLVNHINSVSDQSIQKHNSVSSKIKRGPSRVKRYCQALLSLWATSSIFFFTSSGVALMTIALCAVARTDIILGNVCCRIFCKSLLPKDFSIFKRDLSHIGADLCANRTEVTTCRKNFMKKNVPVNVCAHSLIFVLGSCYLARKVDSLLHKIGWVREVKEALNRTKKRKIAVTMIEGLAMSIPSIALLCFMAPQFDAWANRG